MRYTLFFSSLLLAACETAPAIPEALSGADGGAGNTLIHIAEPFDDEGFRERFAMRGTNDEVAVTADPDGSRDGGVLRVEIPAGSHYGSNFGWRFRDHPPGEPESLYSRYMVYFEPGWNPGRGGKLPGPSGTYGHAGWGGRPADGTNGWSVRMGFRPGWRDDSTQLIFYSYDLAAKTLYGRDIRWDRPSSLLGLDSIGELEHGRWYCVESFIHLNEPGRSNGRLTGWVDGKLATDATGLRFRTTPELKIEEYWFDVYYGGNEVPDETIAVYFDDLLLADTRLGCPAANR